MKFPYPLPQTILLFTSCIKLNYLIFVQFVSFIYNLCSYFSRFNLIGIKINDENLLGIVVHALFTQSSSVSFYSNICLFQIDGKMLLLLLLCVCIIHLHRNVDGIAAIKCVSVAFRIRAFVCVSVLVFPFSRHQMPFNSIRPVSILVSAYTYTKMQTSPTVHPNTGTEKQLK